VVAGITEFDRLSITASAGSLVARVSTAFQDSGLYVMLGNEPGRQLVIDAGPQGANTAGHGHADALSITANNAGRALLIDPGTFEYVGLGLKRNHFRGTKAHNTLVVDRLDQSEPKGPFSWVCLPDVRAEEWINGENFDFFVGSHDGYTRLADPVAHRRSVFSLKSRFWLVRDQALGKGKHQLDLFWHVNPEFSPIEKHKAEFGGAGGLSLVTPEGHGWSQEIQSEDWSPAYGQKEQHNVVHLGRTTTLPAEFVTLLLPEVEGRLSGGSLERITSASTRESAVCYRFKTADEKHHFIFAEGKPWTQFEWSSDAQFLYWGMSQDKKYRMFICINATYVEKDGRKIISGQRSVARFEAEWVDGKIHVTSSDGKIVVDEDLLRDLPWRTTTMQST
jgi:hypothetical protein